jgi:GNAT superfamily N-acetyltransferase
MHYRVATADDLPGLALMRWAFRTEAGEEPAESEAAFMARYAALVGPGMARGEWVYWVATDGGRIVAHMAVGTVRSIPRPARHDDRWGYLTDCYTRPEYRNRGIGSELLAHVRTWCAAQDLEILLVWPSERSEPFYRRAGFTGARDALQLTLRDDVTPPTS